MRFIPGCRNSLRQNQSIRQSWSWVCFHRYHGSWSLCTQCGKRKWPLKYFVSVCTKERETRFLIMECHYLAPSSSKQVTMVSANPSSVSNPSSISRPSLRGPQEREPMMEKAKQMNSSFNSNQARFFKAEGRLISSFHSLALVSSLGSLTHPSSSNENVPTLFTPGVDREKESPPLHLFIIRVQYTYTI